MLLTTTLLQNYILLVTWYFIILLLLTTEYYVIASSSTFNVNNNNNDGYRFYSILPSRQSPISSTSLEMDASLFPGSEEMEGYCRDDDTIITNSNQSIKSRNDTRNQPDNLQYHHTSRIGNNNNNNNNNNIDKKNKKKKVQKLETEIHQNHESKKREKVWKPMKGKVILDFGIDKGIQTINKESKFRTLSNLVHGTKSIVKEKLHSLQHHHHHHHPTYEKKLLETDTDTTMTTTHQIIQQYSHHHQDFTAAIHPPRTNIKNVVVDSFVPINNDAKIQISMDPAAASRMLPFLFCIITSFSSAFLGSIRFLGPLVLGRRGLNMLGKCINDYMTGRYFRKTYTRLERAYLHYYEMPATLRAICRITAQITVYYMLEPIMKWLVGINHPPCHIEGLGLNTFCSMIYIVAILGTGYAFITGVSVWGGPLRIQSANHIHQNDSNVRLLLKKPWIILKWLKDPEELFNGSSVIELPKFDPNPLLFPATWLPLHLLHIYAVSKVLSTDPNEYVFCPKKKNLIPVVLRQFFLQQTLGDEWCRVFLGERRVGLGIAVAFLYFVAILWSAITSARMNAKIAFLMLPSVLAAIISAWMNIIIFYNRIDIKQKKPF